MSKYTRLDFREIYRNPWLGVQTHRIIHPNGVEGEHVLIATPPAVAAVIVDGEDVILTRQPRFGAQTDVVEIVKGGSDAGELPLAAVIRETREELGVEAAVWSSLGFGYEIPSIMQSPVELFLASEIAFVRGDQEAVESIDAVRMPFMSALRAVAAGELSDAITALALVRAAVRLGYLTMREG